MPEQNNDRLEQFFRKAAAKADVTFNEDDWKKLEERLDAADALNGVARKTGSKITAAVVGTLLLVSTALWVNSRYEIIAPQKPEVAVQTSPEAKSPAVSGTPEREAASVKTEERKEVQGEHNALAVQDNADKTDSQRKNERPAFSAEQHPVKVEPLMLPAKEQVVRTNTVADEPQASEVMAQRLAEIEQQAVAADDNNSDAVITERYKQKAVDELPGAEGGQKREAEAMVEEEHASDQKKHVATPRLSLLLFFAPDFSGTSMQLYSAPGKAFGGMLHYHLFNRWSISGGIVKNYKVYTGEGEDYKPPKNYWKYYTNGIIPETIDGSCSILEFPVMVQYTLHNSGKNKWTVGAGMSSYLMQKESYLYNFDQPNPGAKLRWDSKRSSNFMFNMVNFSIGYEHQVAPGLMLGVEPYAKIPLEEIGWSNLKLFSTGASFTLRYTLISKRSPTLSTPGRGPD